MKDVTFHKVMKRWDEVTQLPPQTVGPFTPVYKSITKRLKVMPWPLLVLCGLVTVALLYSLFGSAITFLVSILQRGF